MEKPHFLVRFLMHKFDSTDDWDRTSTSFQTMDFESIASTNSATSAKHIFSTRKVEKILLQLILQFNAKYAQICIKKHRIFPYFFDKLRAVFYVYLGILYRIYFKRKIILISAIYQTYNFPLRR